MLSIFKASFHRIFNRRAGSICFSQSSIAFPSGGLSGIGQGLGPGGQPIDATALNRGGGGGMGNMGPGGKELSL